MAIARLIAITWWLQLKQTTKAGLFVFTSIIEPLIFATLAYYLFKTGRQPGTLLYASLSAGLMGMWTSTLFGSGNVIGFQRWQGVLEPTVAAPPPFILVLFPMTLGALGVLIGSSFVLYREANALSNMLEFPVWIVTGAIVPISLLPGWVHLISWPLAPTWAYR